MEAEILPAEATQRLHKLQAQNPASQNISSSKLPIASSQAPPDTRRDQSDVMERARAALASADRAKLVNLSYGAASAVAAEGKPSNLISIGSKQHKKKVLRTGPIPIGVPVTIYGLSSFFDGSYLPSRKLEPRWILTSALGKTPMGNRYSSDILDKMYIEGRNSADSGAGPSNAAVSSIEEITKRVDKLREKLALISTRRQDVTADHLDWTYFFCWATNFPCCPPYSQKAGESWCIALSRGHAYHIAINKIDAKPVTHEELLRGVSPSHLNTRGGIDSMINAREFMVENGHVKDLILHKRPLDDLEGFESLVDDLLLRGPVVAVFDTFPSYQNYDGKDVYIPEALECHSRRFEKFPQHSSVVTGCGVKVYRGEVTEFWRTQDSQNADWGVDGFAALARHKGLIHTVVEFKF